MRLINMNILCHSLRFKLVISLITFLVPLIALLFYNGFYMVDVLYAQVAKTNHDLLSLYAGQIDADLQTVDDYLQNILVADENVQIINSTGNPNTLQLAKNRLFRRISNDILSYKGMDSLFFYIPGSQDFVYNFTSGSSLFERTQVKEQLTSQLMTQSAEGWSIPDQWFVTQIGTEFYMFRIVRSDNLIAGAWLNTRKLLKPFSLISLGEEGAVLLADHAGQILAHSRQIDLTGVDLVNASGPYGLTGDHDQYLRVGSASTKGNFSLIALIPGDKILLDLITLPRLVFLTAILAIILLPIYLLFLRRILLEPLKQIIKAMQNAKAGDMSARIHRVQASSEFRLVNDTFNSMMTEIHDLKISVYEQQINQQRTELEYLKLQINPHFFMNALNIIYSFAQMKKYKLIQDMSTYLVNHFRFMSGSNLLFVRFYFELKHTANYLQIQELRFPGRIEESIEVPEQLLDYWVPPLVVQTFVENAVKHAISMSEVLKISLKAELIGLPENPLISIRIQDSGRGFEPAILDALRDGQRIVDGRGEHIGIWNVRKRLELLYHGKATISFANSDEHGAIVMMTLPASKGEEPHESKQLSSVDR